jgi:hypothetical protein
MRAKSETRPAAEVNSWNLWHSVVWLSVNDIAAKIVREEVRWVWIAGGTAMRSSLAVRLAHIACESAESQPGIRQCLRRLAALDPLDVLESMSLPAKLEPCRAAILAANREKEA